MAKFPHSSRRVRKSKKYAHGGSTHSCPGGYMMQHGGCVPINNGGYRRGGGVRKFSKGGHTHDFYHIHRSEAVQDGDSGAYYTSRPYYSQDDEGNFNDTPIDRTIQRGKHNHNRTHFAPHANQPFRKGGRVNRSNRNVSSYRSGGGVRRGGRTRPVRSNPRRRRR